VKTAAEGVADDVPANLRIEQAEIRNMVLSWKSDTLLILDRRMQTVRNEISAAQRPHKRAEDTEQELRALEARKRELEATCSELIARAATIRNGRDLARARREFERLKSTFDT
jgi:F0F1-type ATP synthase membrane subunit b/b'